MAKHTDHTLTKGDHLDLTNESSRPMVIGVAFSDGSKVEASLPQGGSIKFEIGDSDAEITIGDGDDAS